MVEIISNFLICANCQRPLVQDGSRFICDHGHSFDIASAGYVNLVAPVGRKPPIGDTAEMIAARLNLLEQGYYAPIVNALVATIQAHDSVETLADLGSGPGYYSKKILTAIPEMKRVIACDSSLPAIKRAARMHPRLGAIRANVRTLIPVKSESVDIALVVFAPRNVSEWWRILTKGGRVLMVPPNRDHLKELREKGLVLNIEEEKMEKLLEQVKPYFELESVRDITWQLSGDRKLVQSIVGMGPTAYHTSLTSIEGVAVNSITGSVSLLSLKPLANQP